MKELEQFPRESLLSQIEDGEQLLTVAGEANSSNQLPSSPSVSPWVVGVSATLGGTISVIVVCVITFWFLSDSQPPPMDVEEPSIPAAVVVDHIDGVEVYESNEVVEMKVNAD